MSDQFGTQFLSSLRRGIVESFDMSELKGLCADLGIDFENLAGESKEAKARELISYLNRRGRLPELIEYCGSVRPNYPWDFAKSAASSVTQGGPTQVGKVTILFLAADPSDLARLRSGQELREIHEKLQLARLRDRFVLEQRMSVRPTDLTQALLDVQPQIVHFSGHGAPTGELAFEDVNGSTHAVPPSALAELFEQFASQVRCVILNACYSETQAQAIAAHIDYVVGMQAAIGDEAAIAFAIGFYQALGAGRSFEEAHKLGCVQMVLQDTQGELTPVLIKKKS